MPLYIYDDEAERLANELQRVTKARTKSGAVIKALANEIERVRKSTPLRERLAGARAKAAAMGPSDPDFDMKAFSDELSGDR